MTAQTKITLLGGNNFSRIGASSHLFEHNDGQGTTYRFLIDLGALFFKEGNQNLKIIPNVLKYLDYFKTKKEKQTPLLSFFQSEKEAFFKKGETALNGVFLTHIHEDHIGGLVLLLKSGFVFPPIYGSKETLSVLGRILIEQNVENMPDLVPINGPVHLSKDITVFPFKTAHTAPGAFGYYILTKDKDKDLAGILDMGDYNFADTLLSNQNQLADLKAFLKDKFITHVFSDSTSSNNPTKKPLLFQEAVQNYKTLMDQTDKRILSAVISRSLENMASILVAAKETGRKVFIDGYMQRLVYDELQKQGKLDLFANTVFQHDEVTKADMKSFLTNTPLNKQVIVFSGAFAEGMNLSSNENQSGLVRLANETHSGLKVSEKDLILLSQRAIPVEEILSDMRLMAQKLGEKNNNQIIQNETNEAFSLGNFEMKPLQRTGHATFFETQALLNTVQNERKNCTDPLYLVPVHGDSQQIQNTLKCATGWQMRLNALPVHNNDQILIQKEGSFVQKNVEKPIYLAFTETENKGQKNTILNVFAVSLQKKENKEFSFKIEQELSNKNISVIEHKMKQRLIHFHRLALLKRERI